METLEHRYYFSGKPYLWILAENMPNASADDFHIIRLKRNTGKEELFHRLITEPADAVYTDIYDPAFLYPLLCMGLVLYFPDRYGKSWPTEKFGTTVYTMGGVSKDRFWELLKRAMDICIGMIGLGAAAAVYPFIAPEIRKQSGGSPLYSQIRIGYNGRPFRMYRYVHTVISFSVCNSFFVCFFSCCSLYLVHGQYPTYSETSLFSDNKSCARNDKVSVFSVRKNRGSYNHAIIMSENEIRRKPKEGKDHAKNTAIF